MTFTIEPAVRENSKVFIQLAGLSGSGKTLSALRLARGLVGPRGKIGFIDTEQKRAGLYADKCGGFDVINMEAPFSPDRYIEAVNTFVDAGYGCVIIDSMSHEWEGVGGVCDMADNQKSAKGKPLQGLGKWKVPKLKHKKMMDHLMHCGMHIIGCYRAKVPLEEVVDAKGFKTMVEGELQICAEQKNIYDITVSLILDEETKKPYINKKCPEDIEWLFMKDEFISEETGDVIVEWLHTKCKDKSELKESFRQFDGSPQDWFATLNKFERYVARKYKSEIVGE